MYIRTEIVNDRVINYFRIDEGPLAEKWTFEVVGEVGEFSTPGSLGFNSLEWCEFYAYEQATRGSNSMWGY